MTYDGQTTLKILIVILTAPFVVQLIAYFLLRIVRAAR